MAAVAWLRSSLPYGRTAFAILCVIGSATAASAQIPSPVLQPKPTISSPILEKQLMRIPPADLVIDNVQIRDDGATLTTLAQVTVRNKGGFDAIFPAGSVLVRAEAAAGVISFKPMTTPVEYSIPAGVVKTLVLVVSDVCNAHPGPVTFRVDPDNKVQEGDETNNATQVQSNGAYAGGDLVPTEVWLKSTSPMSYAGKSSGVYSAYPADLMVGIRNVGTAPVMVCPGTAVWREMESPLSAKYGLREGKVDKLTLVPMSSTLIISFPRAYQPGDLPPGSYQWNVKLNPDGRMLETTLSNNTAVSTQSIR